MLGCPNLPLMFLPSYLPLTRLCPFSHLQPASAPARSGTPQRRSSPAQCTATSPRGWSSSHTTSACTCHTTSAARSPGRWFSSSLPLLQQLPFSCTRLDRAAPCRSFEQLLRGTRWSGAVGCESGVQRVVCKELLPALSKMKANANAGKVEGIACKMRCSCLWKGQRPLFDML